VPWRSVSLKNYNGAMGTSVDATIVNTVKGFTAGGAIRQFVTQYVQKCPSLTGGRLFEPRKEDPE